MAAVISALIDGVVRLATQDGVDDALGSVVATFAIEEITRERGVPVAAALSVAAETKPAASSCAAVRGVIWGGPKVETPVEPFGVNALESVSGASVSCSSDTALSDRVAGRRLSFGVWNIVSAPIRNEFESMQWLLEHDFVSHFFRRTFFPVTNQG
jgi:hypothetical protein